MKADFECFVRRDLGKSQGENMLNN